MALPGCWATIWSSMRKDIGLDLFLERRILFLQNNIRFIKCILKQYKPEYVNIFMDNEITWLAQEVRAWWWRYQSNQQHTSPALPTRHQQAQLLQGNRATLRTHPYVHKIDQLSWG